LMRSIHTAFFMREIPPSVPGFTLMYSDPKRPKTATQSMKRMASQPKRMAALKELTINGRTPKIRAVMALRTPMAVAKPYRPRDQLAPWSEGCSHPYPFAVTVLIHLIGFVQVLCVQANNCERKDDLKDSNDEAENGLQAKARASTVSESHSGEDLEGWTWFVLCFCYGEVAVECCARETVLSRLNL
jgi:hypothetical protein